MSEISKAMPYISSFLTQIFLDSFLQFVGNELVFRVTGRVKQLFTTLQGRIEDKTYEKHRPRQPTKIISPGLCFDVYSYWRVCIYPSGEVFFFYDI